MASLVEQIQANALDRTVPVTDLLRKAKVVAIKLDLPELLAWAEAELNEKVPVPQYRQVAGRLRAYNAVSGEWQAVLFRGGRSPFPTERPVSNKMAEIENLATSDTAAGDSIFMPLPPSFEAQLMRSLEFPTEVRWEISSVSLLGIVDSVRNAILDWSLKLEKAGILGNGLMFSTEEKQMAHDPTTNITIGHVENFSGVAGSVSDRSSVSAQVNSRRDLDLQEIRQFLDQVTDNLNGSGLSAIQKSSLTQQIEIAREQLSQPVSSQSTLKAALISMRSIFEGAAGSLLAQGALAVMASFLK
jgi:AbiTii